MNISAHSAVEIGHRVKFTIRAMDGLGGTSDSYRATLSGKRGTVTDLPERHMALVLWDGHEKPERVVRHYLEPEFTTTPAPDVQAQDHDLVITSRNHVQAQIDAAVARERDRVIGIFVGELQKLHENTVLDCGDNSCLFATRRGGMRTNGGCRCIERLLDAAVAREREEMREAVCEEIDKRTGPTGGWLCSPKKMVDAVYRVVRARSGAKGV